VLRDQVVAAVAEQRHVLVGEPAQEVAAFGDLRCRQRRGHGIELGDRLLQARQHRLPVLDCGAHVAEHALDARDQVAALLRIDQPVDLDVHPRLARGLGGFAARADGGQPPGGVALDREDRMHDQVQRQPLPVDLGRGRVDQERHVVVDDLDHRVARGPPVLGQRGAEHAHLRHARRAGGAELPVRQHRARQVLGCALDEIVVVELAEVLACEALEHGATPRGQARCGKRQHRIEPLESQRIRRGVHRVVSSLSVLRDEAFAAERDGLGEGQRGPEFQGALTVLFATFPLRASHLEACHCPGGLHWSCCSRHARRRVSHSLSRARQRLQRCRRMTNSPPWRKPPAGWSFPGRLVNP
jgi:hypothetical protein